MSDSDDDSSHVAAYSGNRKRARSQVKIPSWKDRMSELVSMLRDRSSTVRGYLSDSSSVEEILHAARAEVEKTKLQVELLETKLQLKATLAQPNNEKRRKSSNSDNSSVTSSVHSPVSEDSTSSYLFPSNSEPSRLRINVAFTRKPVSPASTSNSSSSSSSSSYLPSASPSPSSHTALVPVPRNIQSARAGFLHAYSHQEAIMSAPFSFFSISPSFRLIECNEAFVHDLMDSPCRAGVPIIPNRQWLIAQNIPLLQLYGLDLSSDDCPPELQYFLHQITVALSDGISRAQNARYVDANGNVSSCDITIWTTYETNGEGQSNYNKPVCVNFITLEPEGYEPRKALPEPLSV